MATATDSISFEQAAASKFPFGKHKGKRISETPIEYLVWAADTATYGGPFQIKVRAYLDHPSVSELAGEARKRSKKSTKDPPPEPLIIAFPLSHGNQIEIRLQRKVTRQEMATVRQLFALAEQAIVEDEPVETTEGAPDERSP